MDWPERSNLTFNPSPVGKSNLSKIYIYTQIMLAVRLKEVLRPDDIDESWLEEAL